MMDDQDDFDELFAEQPAAVSGSGSDIEDGEAKVESANESQLEEGEQAHEHEHDHEHKLDPQKRSQRAKKLLEASFEEDQQEDEDDDSEEYSQDELSNDPEARPKNRPKIIPPGLQPDDKILEARRDFEEALAKLKPTRRRRDGDSEELGFDDVALQFTNKMLAAVKADDEAVAAERPALAKLKMLSEVEEMLLKKHLQEVLLDNQVLDCIKKWLEPNIRGHLAVHSLRKRLLELLALLPIETTHLRESGIGRIVMFYYTREKESLDIRKLAGDLIATWSRPIIGTSLDYREMINSARGNRNRNDDEDEEGVGVGSSSSRQQQPSKQLQSEKYKRFAKSGALDRANGRTASGRYQRLTQTLNRQKKRQL